MFEWHLNDPAQVASTQPAERILGGSVPQAALSDGAMKVATSVPVRDASVLLYASSNVLKSAVRMTTLMRSKLADSWRICRGRSDLRRSSKATCMQYQTGVRHHVKENYEPGLDHSWSCRVLPLFSELLHDCNVASSV